MRPEPLPMTAMRAPTSWREISVDDLLVPEDEDTLADRIAAKVLAGLRPAKTEPAVSEAEYLNTADAARRLGIDRGTLDQMVARAPRDLPGGPVHVGEGKARRHLRWPASTLQTWVDAFREFERTRGKRR